MTSSDPSSHSVSIPDQIQSERFHLVIPSLPEWITPTVEYLVERSVHTGVCQESRSGKLLMALQEALTNSVIHGNLEVSSSLKERADDSFAQLVAQRASDPRFASRIVDIFVDYDGTECKWIFTDQGQGFEVERVLERVLSDDPEILLASGRGILMMHSLLDGLDYEMGGRRCVLKMRRHSGQERRNEYRVPVNLPFKVIPTDADGKFDWEQAYDAVSRNLSVGGVSLLQEALAQSEKVLIGFATEPEMIYLPALLRHFRCLETGGLEIGCEFQIPEQHSPMAPPTQRQQKDLQTAIETVLKDYLDSTPEKQDERRANPRVPYNERVELIPLSPPGAVAIVGYARDLSKGGMALISKIAVPRNVILVFPSMGDRSRLRVRCEAVRCQKFSDGYFDVGVRFLCLNEAKGE